MALALSSEELQLEEGFLFVGTYPDPENIGAVGGGDPESHFTSSGIVGYLERGTMVIGVNREYAEAESGTSAVKIRKDMIRKTYMITGNSLQINNPDLWEIRDGYLVQKNFVDSGFTGDIAHIGPGEPTSASTARGWLLKARDVTGEPHEYALYFGRVTTEDISENRSGDAYVSIPIQIEAFPHPNFDVSVPAEKEKAYGSKWNDRS
jgi:hypothetical protein